MQRRVVLLGPVPEIGVDVPMAMAKAIQLDKVMDLYLPLEQFEARQAFVVPTLQALGQSPGVEYIDIAHTLCGATRCEAQLNGVPMYFDSNHLASTGAQQLIPVLGSVVSTLVNSND